MGQVEIDHNHVGLESLRCIYNGPAVCDVPHDFAVQRQHAADGFRHPRVVLRYQHAWAIGHH